MFSGMWQGMQDVVGSRSAAMTGLKKSFGTYDVYDDPEYIKDMQYLQQNPTQQNLGAFANKYLDYLPGEDIETVVSNMKSGMDYLEGSPQDVQHQMNLNDLEQSNIKTEAMPKFTEYELTAGEIANDISRLQRDYRTETDPIRIQILENDLELANKTLQDKIALSGLQVRQGRAGARTAESNARVSEGTEAPRIQDAKTQAAVNLLNKSLFEDTYSAQVNKPYIQNAGTILGNNAQVTRNRILNKTADNQITMSDIETELARLQKQQAQDEFEFMSGLDDKVRYGMQPEPQKQAIDAKEYLPTPEGMPQLALNSADVVVFAQTGEPYIDGEGNAFTAEKSFLSGQRTFKPVNVSNIYNSGTQGGTTTEPPGSQTEDEPTTWDNVINRITGKEQNNNQIDINSVINNFKTNNPDLTATEMADRLEQMNPEEFKKETGLDINTVIDRLRMMRW